MILGVDIMIVIHLEEDMISRFFSTPAKTALRFVFALTVIALSFASGNTNTAYAGSGSSPEECGQLLADAKAKFLATLASDGSVPATPEVKAAAQEYIRVSKLCYDQIAAQNPAGSLQGDSPTFIDEGGMMLAGSQASAEYVLTNKKWGSSALGTPGGTITYSFMGNGKSLSAESSSIGSSVAITSLPGFQPCFITQIQTAFAAWQAVSNVKFVQVEDNGAAFDAPGATGEIRIAAHVFDGPSGTLAHAYYPPPNGNSAAGDLHFDSQESWTCDNRGLDIGIVALHEIGHTIGLAHENTSAVAVMDPYYNSNLTGLQTDDIHGADAIYGTASVVSAPGNDDFDSATPILSANIPYTDNLNTTGATPPPLQGNDDPLVTVPCDGTLMAKGYATVWYAFTPNTNRSVYLDTLNTDYDTYIAVWKGSRGSLSLVSCDDDTFSGLQSQLRLDPVPGTTYYIEIAEYTTEQGNPLPTVTSVGGNLFFHVSYTNLDISINNVKKGSYNLTNSEVLTQSYSSMQDGPVKVTNTADIPFFTSERVISGTSFNEVMGYPTDQLTTEYWYPFYDNVSMATWILVGNASTSQIATVDIYIGGVKRGSYSIAQGSQIRPRFNLQTGPVRVVSTNGVKIFTSERAVYKGAFNEVMGYPANQFTTEYWFPFYDNVSMDAWILVGNPSATQTAAVDIYIGGAKKGSYSIPKGGRITPRFNIAPTGPVRVVATNGVKIFSSERSLYGDSFNEVMGSPANQFTTEYWYPWYDNVGMDTWVLVGNPTGNTAAVDIYIGGTKVVSTTVKAGGRITPRYALNAGPVRVVSTNGVKIFSSERVLYGTSFNEVMGYPGNKMTIEYWFPWYDSATMSTNVLAGMP
jgi:hypothetical protein